MNLVGVGRSLPAWDAPHWLRTHQSLLYKQAEQDGVAHFPQALEHVCFELRVLNDVLQLMVEELQDPWGVKGDSQREVDAAQLGSWKAPTEQSPQT